MAVKTRIRSNGAAILDALIHRSPNVSIFQISSLQWPHSQGKSDQAIFTHFIDQLLLLYTLPNWCYKDKSHGCRPHLLQRCGRKSSRIYPLAKEGWLCSGLSLASQYLTWKWSLLSPAGTESAKPDLVWQSRLVGETCYQTCNFSILSSRDYLTLHPLVELSNYYAFFFFWELNLKLGKSCNLEDRASHLVKPLEIVSEACVYSFLKRGYATISHSISIPYQLLYITNMLSLWGFKDIFSMHKLKAKANVLSRATKRRRCRWDEVQQCE